MMRQHRGNHIRCLNISDGGFLFIWVSSITQKYFDPSFRPCQCVFPKHLAAQNCSVSCYLSFNFRIVQLKRNKRHISDDCVQKIISLSKIFLLQAQNSHQPFILLKFNKDLFVLGRYHFKSLITSEDIKTVFPFFVYLLILLMMWIY